MAEFSYGALKKDGSKVTGSLEAGDRSEAIRKLSRQGLEPFSVELADGPPMKSGSGFRSKPKAGDPAAPVTLNSKEVILFTEELSDLLQAGLQLEPALRSMEGRSGDSGIKHVAQRVREKVRDGMSFSRALNQVSPSFGDLYVNLAEAGEASGALEEILKRQAVHMKMIAELKSKVSVALIYPGFLLFSGLAVFVVFITHLVPKLTELILSTGSKEVPGVVKFLIAFSDIMKGWGWAILIVLIMLIVIFQKLTTSAVFRPTWHRTVINLPFVGPMLRSNFYVQFLETMANLLSNGIEMLRSLELVRNATPNLHLKSSLDEVVSLVRDGVPLSRALRKSGEFPDLLTDLVRVGEETGEMKLAMARAGERFDKELGQKIERLNALIQPVIILIMAAGVGTMAYLMITIIYDTISTMRAR